MCQSNDHSQATRKKPRDKVKQRPQFLLRRARQELEN